MRTLQVSLGDLRKLASEKRLYALVDACDAPESMAKIRELGPDRARCLYRGDIGAEMEEIAPYLASCDETLLQWLIEKGTDPWGILVVAQIEPKKLLRHLRKFLLVQGPDGETLYFRYYDPQILVAFLASCNSAELCEFFGQIQAFGSTGENAGTLFLSTSE
jgi:hypothetical protein